ncbi:MAG: lytic transglycosylase domain-containing protein [Odoribacter sp.]|nr:lytic transglycosylase domain-containing protein [Odoribacter sp.]
MTHIGFSILKTISAGILAAGVLSSCVKGVAAAPETPAGNQFAQVINPAIPSKMAICGQDIDLDITDYYERFDRELTSLTYTHGTTLLILKRANRYFPQLAPILRQNGVPEDLLYLACVESSLNPRAVSPAKAAGIWQFMPATAKEFGLEVSDEIDERYNIEKATNAACRYFKRALSRYNGDWASVMASYNAGMTRVSGQLGKQGADGALDLYLADETMRYPFRVMAMKTILENPRDYGFMITAEQLYQPREVEIVEVSGAVESWADWASEHGISYLTLRDENPWIRSPKLTNKAGKTYRVRVPMKESRRRSTARTSVFNPNWAIR